MRLVRLLPQRLRHLAPEAFAFGVIGALNSVVYLGIVTATMGIGVVKANIVASLVTTTLSYFANRHWTYKHRPRTALRREYTLFFAFNFAGMVIQSGAAGFGKYGLGLTERDHRLGLLAFTLGGIALATVFRFWAYRTFVFLKVAAPAPAPRLRTRPLNVAPRARRRGEVAPHTHSRLGLTRPIGFGDAALEA